MVTTSTPPTQSQVVKIQINAMYRKDGVQYYTTEDGKVYGECHGSSKGGLYGFYGEYTNKPLASAPECDAVICCYPSAQNVPTVGNWNEMTQCAVVDDVTLWVLPRSEYNTLYRAIMAAYEAKHGPVARKGHQTKHGWSFK